MRFGSVLEMSAFPWTYSEDVDTRGQRGFRIDSKDRSLIAWVPIGHGGEEEALNTARLIAAAPALLLACNALMKASPMQQGERNGYIMGQISTAIDLAREALAGIDGKGGTQ